jgi:thiol-disulfide isomerase/thioredoxin
MSLKLAPIVFAVLWSGLAAAENHGPAPSCPAKTVDGTKVVDLAHSPGKVTYVDFWASWCGPCAQSFPFMNQLHAELHKQGVEIVAVNLDEDPKDAADFLKSHPANFTVVVDPQGKCPAVYEVKAMPTTYIIDRKGEIRHIHMGFKEGSKAEIKKQVQALLSE